MASASPARIWHAANERETEASSTMWLFFSIVSCPRLSFPAGLLGCYFGLVEDMGGPLGVVDHGISLTPLPPPLQGQPVPRFHGTCTLLVGWIPLPAEVTGSCGRSGLHRHAFLPCARKGQTNKNKSSGAIFLGLGRSPGSVQRWAVESLPTVATGCFFGFKL